MVKWDAAFRYLRNPALGFDFKDSPFGRDPFDNYSPPVNDTRYEDIFTGFIFYRPIEEWSLIQQNPYIMSEEFKPEFKRREKIIDPNMSDERLDDRFIAWSRFYTPSVYGDYVSKDSVDVYINEWLR